MLKWLLQNTKIYCSCSNLQRPDVPPPPPPFLRASVLPVLHVSFACTHFFLLTNSLQVFTFCDKKNFWRINILRYNYEIKCSVVQQSNSCLCSLILMPLDYTHTHTVGVLWTGDQPVSEATSYTTQTQETNFHALSGIRTRDPSIWAATDLRLRPHCLQDWFTRQLLGSNMYGVSSNDDTITSFNILSISSETDRCECILSSLCRHGVTAHTKHVLRWRSSAFRKVNVL